MNWLSKYFHGWGWGWGWGRDGLNGNKAYLALVKLKLADVGLELSVAKHFSNKSLICFYNFLTNLNFLVYWLTDLPKRFLEGVRPKNVLIFHISQTSVFINWWRFIKWWIFITNINHMHEFSLRLLTFFSNYEFSQKWGFFLSQK